MQHINWWALSWGVIPADQVNGILLGYRLSYYMSYKAGSYHSGEIKRTIKKFDIYTFYYKVVGLINYATYTVTLSAYTVAGEGPVDEYFASKGFILL